MSATKPWIWAIVFAVAALLAAPATGEKRAPASRAQIQISFAPLVKKAAPAVVNIYTRKVMRRRAIAPPTRGAPMPAGRWPRRPADGSFGAAKKAEIG